MAWAAIIGEKPTAVAINATAKSLFIVLSLNGRLLHGPDIIRIPNWSQSVAGSD
jgi:hypothetical protein